ncbi:hypothetical protein CEXT_230731 [Caerostris extrusa]|uniref:Uncharacterized protein n=1 Tax=Caerostris extrusa TaxID=172846 RepID=A0AAV4W094_CAEEX|nr:hypothetical protein CEXT_230731 [Caerostris extrusa]
MVGLQIGSRQVTVYKLGLDKIVGLQRWGLDSKGWSKDGSRQVRVGRQDGSVVTLNPSNPGVTHSRIFQAKIYHSTQVTVKGVGRQDGPRNVVVGPQDKYVAI